MEPSEDSSLIPCRRVAAAVIAQAFHDLEFSKDHWRTAYHYLTVTLWKPGHLWRELLAHILVEHKIRQKALELRRVAQGKERKEKEYMNRYPLARASYRLGRKNARAIWQNGSDLSGE